MMQIHVTMQHAVTCHPHSPVQQSFDNFGLTAFLIDLVYHSHSPCSISPPPSQFNSISPIRVVELQAFGGAAVEAAVTGTADILN